jgi:large conductance mechanosensitive channel
MTEPRLTVFPPFVRIPRLANGSEEKGDVMLREFKDFLTRGNLIELAVAFVMGVAFAALLTAFVDDIVTPIIGAVFGKTDFSNLTFTINNSKFFYGAFITAIIQFVTIAAGVFFLIVRPVQALAARRTTTDEEVVSDEERRHQELLAALRAG